MIVAGSLNYDDDILACISPVDTVRQPLGAVLDEYFPGIMPKMALIVLEHAGPGHEGLAVSALDALLQPRSLVALLPQPLPSSAASSRKLEEELLPWLLGVRSALMQVYYRLFEWNEGGKSLFFDTLCLPLSVAYHTCRRH